MDILKTTEPKSDQQNFDDYIGGPKTVTISEVKKGSTEQPVEIHLAEFPGHPFKPSKSMRRVLVAAWGPEAATYVGRRMTLYGDPTVKFGGAEVGGVRISHLSDIPEALSIGLTVTRGKRAPFIVKPLDAPATLDDATVNEWAETFKFANSLEALQAAWEEATKAGVTKDPRVVAAKDQRKQALA